MSPSQSHMSAWSDSSTRYRNTEGTELRGGRHWDRRGPIKATLGKSQANTPLVTISTGLGFDGDYTPAQIRAYARTLLRIADDADKRPMGPRSYHRSVRGYDVT